MRALLLLGLSVAAPALLLASCADSESESPAGVDASVVVPPGPDASDAGADAAPCDPADPSCVSTPLGCAEADFCPVPSPIDRRYRLTAVAGSGPADVWAVGSGGTILRWDGAAWALEPSGTTETLNALWVPGPGEAWAVGSTATLLHRIANAWTASPPFAADVFLYPGRAHAVWGRAAAEPWVGGAPFFADVIDAPVQGNLLRREGSAWTASAGVDGRFAQATVGAIWGAPGGGDAWLALDDGTEQPWARGTIVRGSDAGGWTALDSKATAPFEAIWGANANDVWAVGGGAIRRWQGGASFSVVDAAPVGISLHAVWGSGPDDVWVVGDGGTILHFDGTAWSEATVAFPLGRKPDLHGVWGSGSGDVWVVGDVLTLHFTGKKPRR